MQNAVVPIVGTAQFFIVGHNGNHERTSTATLMVLSGILRQNTIVADQYKADFT